MIWLVHGFLGRAADWDGLARALAAAGIDEVRRCDLFAPEPADPDPDLELRPGRASPDLPTWGERFAARATATGRRPVVVGYSLGARLALHALLAAPEAWRAAILVSAHPGLASEAERSARRAADEVWARRFETDAWADLMRAWHAQPVFGGRGGSRARGEARFDRTRLAAALRVWSLGTQENLRPRLRTLRCPVLWLAGDGDEKFVRVARDAAPEVPDVELRIVEGAGHRVPWEAPDAFHALCRTFLSRLKH